MKNKSQVLKGDKAVHKNLKKGEGDESKGDNFVHLCSQAISI